MRTHTAADPECCGHSEAAPAQRRGSSPAPPEENRRLQGRGGLPGCAETDRPQRAPTRPLRPKTVVRWRRGRGPAKPGRGSENAKNGPALPPDYWLVGLLDTDRSKRAGQRTLGCPKAGRVGRATERGGGSHHPQTTDPGAGVRAASRTQAGGGSQPKRPARRRCLFIRPGT